jgi:hypothetical protein
MRERARAEEISAGILDESRRAGVEVGETAETTSQSVHVVRHDLQFAQAWLRRRLQDRTSQL